MIRKLFKIALDRTFKEDLNQLGKRTSQHDYISAYDIQSKLVLTAIGVTKYAWKWFEDHKK